MKSKLTLACLMFSTALMAQVANNPTVLNLNERTEEYGYGIVPKSLSYDGTNRVYIRTEDDQVAIYSNTFSPVKSFSISPTYANEQVVEMERTVTVTVTGEGENRQVSFSYGDWTQTDVETYDVVQNWGIGFVNYDNDITSNNYSVGDGLSLTQTLFNEDNKYEYLSFPISSYERYDGNRPVVPDDPICSDCYEESTSFTETEFIHNSPVFKGFNVMSEDGSILQSISFPNGFQMVEYVYAQIIKLSEEYYIVCQGEMNDNAALLVYKINRTTTGSNVQQVTDPQRVATAYKFLRNGNVYIHHTNGSTYDTTGKRVK